MRRSGRLQLTEAYTISSRRHTCFLCSSERTHATASGMPKDAATASTSPSLSPPSFAIASYKCPSALTSRILVHGGKSVLGYRLSLHLRAPTADEQPHGTTEPVESVLRGVGTVLRRSSTIDAAVSRPAAPISAQSLQQSMNSHCANREQPYKTMRVDHLDSPVSDLSTLP